MPEESIDRTISVAPMMDWTTRHCRFFLRLVSRRALLYTEMLTTGALLHGDRGALLAHDPGEHPLAVQLGGSDPRALAACARICEDAGFAEVNLNVGCPSDRVQSGRFGACLMAEPDLVAECVAAMRAAVAIPVTVKTRLGVDDRDTYELLADFVARIAAAGCRTVILHARKAWLRGLSPKENREIPPLEYGKVHRVKADFPALEVIVNGGVRTLDQAAEQLEQVDGVMIGREACHNPWLLADVDRRFHGEETGQVSREAVLAAYRPYVAAELARGTPPGDLHRHLLGLYQGIPGARAWRRRLSTPTDAPGALIDAALEALHAVQAHGRQRHRSSHARPLPAPLAQAGEGAQPGSRPAPA